LATISAMLYPASRRCAAYDSLSGSTTGRPADPPALRGRDRPGVRGPLQGVGALHLAEQRQQHDRELRHRVRRVGRVDPDRVGEVAHPDAALGQLVNEVEGVPNGPAQPVQGVHHDHITVPGVRQCRFEPGPVGRCARLLVQVDPLRRDPGLVQRVDLPVQVLLRGRDPRIAKIHSPKIPKLVPVRLFRHALVGLTSGTAVQAQAKDGRIAARRRPTTKDVERWLAHPTETPTHSMREKRAV